MPVTDGETLGTGTHWAIRVGFSDSVSGPGIAPSIGGTVAVIQIRNLDTGEIGTYAMTGLDFGSGIGIGTSVGNGQWQVFETVHSETLGSFEGQVRMPSLQVGAESIVSRIVLPVEIKHDNVFSRLWEGNSVDVSGTALSVGLGISDGVGELSLGQVTQGPPEPSIGEAVQGVMNRDYEEYGTSHPDFTLAPSADVDHGAGDDAGQIMSAIPAASDPADSAQVSLLSNTAYTSGEHDVALHDSDLSAGVGLADQPSPDALMSTGWDPGDGSFGVGLADDYGWTGPEAGAGVSVMDLHGIVGFTDDGGAPVGSVLLGGDGAPLDDLTSDWSPAMPDPGFQSGDHGADASVDPGSML